MYSSEVSVFDFIYRSNGSSSLYFVGNPVVHQNQLILVFILKLVIVFVLQNGIDDAKELLIFLLSVISDLPNQNQISICTAI